MPRPLDGVVVLDLSRLLPGPFCTQLLANLGADVIKVEDPALGDYMRAVPPAVGDTSYPFLMVNRGKRSIVIDLRTKTGRGVLYRLARKADVFVEQFRPSTVKALGIDYPRLRRANPRLVYCSFGGFGRTGPYADKPAHDLNFEALAGILSVTASRPGERPAIPGVPVSDLASACLAAFSIIASLHRRERFGGGEFLEVAIFDTSVSLMVLNLARYLGTGDIPVPGETIVTGIFPFYSLYETADGRWLSVACVEPKFWRRLCEILETPELIDDQFVSGVPARPVVDRISIAFKAKTLAAWTAIFDREGLPVMPVLRVDEVVADPQVAARDLLPEVRVGKVRRRVLAHPAKARASSIRTLSAAPGHGEHTDEILRWAGYSARQVKDLRAAGAVGLTGP
ncbi:MAG: CoA transferase [Methanobacteriota archaeon]|nr:MAG: CoA transferase [Euryarchaeota archaeon]